MLTLSSIVDKALKLSPEERELLANTMVESLDESELTEVEEAWLPILEERYEKYLTGESSAVPAKDALSKIREDYGWSK